MPAYQHHAHAACELGDAEEDTDIVMFSPQQEHGAVIDHIRRKVSG